MGALRFRLVVPWFLIASLSACGVAQSPRAAQPTVGSQGEPFPMDWDNPIQGETVDSYADARSDVSFDAREPNLDNLRAIFVTALDRSSSSTRALAFRFDSATYGRVWVVEERLQIDPKLWEQDERDLIARKGQPGYSGSSEIVTIKGGIPAILRTSDDGSDSFLRWVEGQVLFTVEGPNLNKDACVAVAQRA